MTRVHIKADTFMDAVAKAINADPYSWRRVVIDAQVGCPVRIYIEQYGTKPILDVAQTLEGIEITTVGKEEGR